MWKDKSGARQESTDYHNVVVFGRQAETAAQYLKKGASVLVEGRMQTRSWDAPDGQKKYKTEVVADRVQFGPRREGGSGGASSNSAGAPSKETSAGAKKEETIEYPTEEINPDDIPF